MGIATSSPGFCKSSRRRHWRQGTVEEELLGLEISFVYSHLMLWHLEVGKIPFAFALYRD